MCREQNLDRLRGIEDVSTAKLLRWIEEVSSKQRVKKIGSMDQDIYREVLGKTRKTLIEKLSVKRYQATIKLLLS